jgi:hypothetical protein
MLYGYLTQPLKRAPDRKDIQQRSETPTGKSQGLKSIVCARSQRRVDDARRLKRQKPLVPFSRVKNIEGRPDSEKPVEAPWVRQVPFF